MHWVLVLTFCLWPMGGCNQEVYGPFANEADCDTAAVAEIQRIVEVGMGTSTMIRFQPYFCLEVDGTKA